MKLLMHLFPEFFPFEQHDPDQEQEADSDSAKNEDSGSEDGTSES